MARSFDVVDVVQGTDEWMKVRCGLLTGSRADDMLAKLKSAKGEAAPRRDLRISLVCERLTGRHADTYVSADMKRGRALEAAAVATYEAQTGRLVRRVGFLKHLELPVGCSLDGYLGDFKGIVECKAPRSANHLAYIRAGVLPEDYRGQVLHSLWISGAEFCDFVSYDERMPPDLQLFIVRVERNEFELMAYARTVEAFLAEVDAELASVRALRTVVAA